MSSDETRPTTVGPTTRTRAIPSADLPNGTPETVLGVRDLTYTHQGQSVPTVASVNLSVPAGQMMALVGPSGSGKTTVLRLVAGLESPDSGDVLVSGVSQRHTPPERRGMTMMFQRPLLFPHLDVLDNIGFADRVAGSGRSRSRRRAARYLDMVHLGDLGTRRPGALSGGQEQRVALARALAARPGVLLLDEPFSALDAGVRQSMHDLLAEVRAVVEPTTLMVTHDMDEAAMADTVAVMAAGKIQQVAHIDVLYAQPATVDVARVLGGFAEVPGHAQGGRHHSPLGIVALPRASRHLTGDVVLLARREGLRVGDPLDPSAVYAGRVVSVQRHGMRQSALVEPDAAGSTRPGRLWAEADLGAEVRPGERVGLRLTGVGLCALPQPPLTAEP
ncbi:MAG: ABC transporter ATP-binding protein [Pedococcus sp.]